MYLLSAPINKNNYYGIELSVSNDREALQLKIEQKYFYAANSLHGSVYFKMLNDTAFFCC